MAEAKVAMVTGATRGIGRCGALDLASRGYDVVVTGRTVHEGDAKEAGVVIPGSLDATAAQIEGAWPALPADRHGHHGSHVHQGRVRTGHA